MAVRAKIIFTGDVNLYEFELVDKYSSWTTLEWNEVRQDRYALTGEEANIRTVNNLYYMRIKPVFGQKFGKCYRTNSGGTSNLGDLTPDNQERLLITPWIDVESGPVVNNYVHISIKQPPQVKITGTLENCSCNYSNGEQLTNSKPNIIIKAKGKGTFPNEYTLTQYGLTEDFIKSKDNKTLTYSITDYNADIVLDDDYIATGGKTTFTIITNLTNITSDIPTTIEKNAPFNFNLTAKMGFEIDSIQSNIGTVDIASDKLSATIKGTATDNITITASATEIKTAKVIITGTLENCSCNYSNGEPMTDAKPNITITAKSGFQFMGAFTYQNSYGLTEEFNKNPENTILTAPIDLSGDITLDDNYKATGTPQSVTSFVHLYKVNDKILNELSKVRFQNNNDYGSQILMLYVLPITLPTDLIGDETSIVLGDYDSNVNAPQIMNGEFTIDCGNILVNKKYNNAIDFLNNYRDLTVVSPFFEPFTLITDEFIGHECNIKYIVNLYGGTLTRIITNTFNGKQNRSTTPISNSIPFIERASNSVVNSLTSYNYTDGETMIIDKRQNYMQPETYSSYYGVAEHCFKQLKEIKGYAEIDNVHLKTTATEPQQNEIKKLLQDGVFFN